jgi:imidazolonepropionase-like amidohydrolase
MPGMVEAHTHLTWASSVEKIYHQFILPPEELEVAATRNARVLLDHGLPAPIRLARWATASKPASTRRSWLVKRPAPA